MSILIPCAVCGNKEYQPDLAPLLQKSMGCVCGKEKETPVTSKIATPNSNETATAKAVAAPDQKAPVVVADGAAHNTELAQGQLPDIPSQVVEVTAVGSLLQHTGPVTGLAVSPSGDCLMSCSQDHSLICWDMASQHVRWHLKGHTDQVFCVVLMPDGTFAMSGGNDETIRVWSLAGQTGGHCLATLNNCHMTKILCMAMSPDGKLLASGSADRTIQLWDIAMADGEENKEDGKVSGPYPHLTKRGKPLTGHNSWVCALAITPDCKVLVSGSSHATIKLWSLPNGEPLQTLEGHSDQVRCLALHQKAPLLVSGSRDKTVRVWDLGDNPAPLATLYGHKDFLYAVSLTPDGVILGSTSADGTLQLWNLKTIVEVSRKAPGLRLRRPSQGGNGLVPVAVVEAGQKLLRSMVVMPDGKTVVTGGEDGSIKLWRMEL